MINKTKNILPPEALKTLNLTLIQSHLNYGTVIWGNNQHRGKLSILLKKSIRNINRKGFNFHTEPLYKQNGLLRLDDIYQLNIATFMFKLKTLRLPSSFNYLNYFQHIIVPLTRQTNLANCMRFRTNFTSNLPLHTFPRIWNGIGNYLHSITSLNKLKSRIRNHFMDQYRDNIECNNQHCRQCRAT